jgi:ABC-type histidine transport system ATPase subunit
MAMQPDLLLLDEVTSALDPELIAEVLNFTAPREPRTREFLQRIIEAGRL